MFTQPLVVAFRFRQGAAHTMRYTWRAAGVPVDLTGWTALMHVRDAAGELAYALSTTPDVGDGTITLGSSTDNITLGPLPGPLEVGEYKHDLRLTNADETEIGYFFAGSLVVEPRVTE